MEYFFVNVILVISMICSEHNNMTHMARVLCVHMKIFEQGKLNAFPESCRNNGRMSVKDWEMGVEERRLPPLFYEIKIIVLLIKLYAFQRIFNFQIFSQVVILLFHTLLFF